MTQQPQPTQAAPSREGFWRVLAALMLVAVAWIGWVAYQVAPRSVVTPAAYDALAQAKIASRVQTGIIRPVERGPQLRLAERIDTPIPEK